ncbi:MAG: hypothetical protein ABWW70_07205 [Thermoproteota archaeon]
MKRATHYALLSGVHATIPLAELRALLSILDCTSEIREVADRIVLISSSCPVLRAVAERSGMIVEVGRLLDVVHASEVGDDNVGELASRIAASLCSILGPGSTLRVSAKELRGLLKVDSTAIAGRLASKLAKHVSECGIALSPKSYTKELRLLLYADTLIVGLKEGERDLRRLNARRPSKRPFFYSGSLDPRLARALVNLSRPRPGDLYLDPFCGSGGFAIEAADMGLITLCGELDERLSKGALANVSFYGGGSHTDVVVWDARFTALRDNSIDAVSTDPPYGRSVSTRGVPLETLFLGFLEEVARVLRRGRYISSAAPHWVDVEELVEKAGLKPVELHYMRVHGSLTRKVIVALKP